MAQLICKIKISSVGMHFLTLNKRNILVPKSFDFVKSFVSLTDL